MPDARQEIINTLVQYATAIDSRDWALLRDCFVDDVEVDYGPFGGVRQGFDGLMAIVGTVAGFDATQHLLGNFVIDIENDHARGRCYFQAQHALSGSVFTVGGTYQDELIRTPAGWQIRRRRLDITWQTGDPALAQAAAERAGTKSI